jgi:hypothetical protein
MDKFVMCHISLKGQYQGIGEAANGFTGKIDCISVFNLIPSHMINDKITYTSPRKLLSHREATFPLEKKNMRLSPDLRRLRENFSL